MFATEYGERYYALDDPDRILVTSAVGPRPENGRRHHLNLLCGHTIVSLEGIDAGFGTQPHHVPCPACKRKRGDTDWNAPVMGVRVEALIARSD